LSEIEVIHAAWNTRRNQASVRIDTGVHDKETITGPSARRGAGLIEPPVTVGEPKTRLNVQLQMQLASGRPHTSRIQMTCAHFRGSTEHRMALDSSARDQRLAKTSKAGSPVRA
jgi:hypothetical protein